ncbi:peptide chain release factor 1 [Geochorda subterranea]|uniref:Peptide chain release factor 1 n=1 Tax=Geochorda subterranea TaxID=3109564 RepID=A0ABZ1BQE6_9FIRM|nr:peptide chain release factor 1 [Limnochorda sp. LNt]WRP14820.1 peptide chain release factor 1 [Limnochorda sp. LNt]
MLPSHADLERRLAAVEERYDELTRRLADPGLASDPAELRKVAQAHARTGEIVESWREYRRVREAIRETRSLLEEGPVDGELRELAEAEIEALERRREEIERQLWIMLLPRDPHDDRSVIVEIRAGTGGEEAALFAADLFRMYTRYAERRGWRTELIAANPTELGGFKEVVFSVTGEGAFSRLKYERGVHRVQRVPVTEASGRIHTSTATVAVLPEPEEVEVQIRPEELEIDVFRASGHGGQHVNTTDSAVRITHKPTGIVVTCQDERSQLKNRERAMKVLRARLYDMMLRDQEQRLARERRSQVGTGERSERIRTYNFPQNRVTDHRIGLTVHRLDAVLQEGDLDEFIDALILDEQSQRLAAMQV